MDETEQPDAEEDRIYEYLLDSGVLNDVHGMAESIAGSSTADWSVGGGGGGDDDAADDAQRIADRLLEQNADDVDRALEAIVRDARLAADVRLVDGRWTGLLEIGPGRTPRQTIRNLDALARLPFAYDTYAGTYFRKLTKGLEHAYVADAFFAPAARVYAKLVDAAPDPECAAESFASLCEATHLRCLRPDFGKSVAAVCLLIRCLAAVCARCAGSKSVRSAVAEFVATVIRTDALHRQTGRPQDHLHRSDAASPYAILCCADPTARWFDRVCRYHSCRSAFFECLDGDRNLLKTVVSGFLHWMAEPIIPNRSDKKGATTVVRYACCLHATYLLAKMFEYRRVRTMFPVRVSRTTRVQVASVSSYCLGFLSANRDRAPATLARGMRKLVAAVAAYHHPEVIDAIVESPSCFGVRILAEVAATRPGALDGAAVDELFRRRHWRDGGDAYLESLTAVAAALSENHETVWRLVTGWMSFLGAAAAAGDDDSRHGRNRRTLLANVRSTPLAASTYDLGRPDAGRDGEFDWSDPRQRLVFSVALTTGTGVDWLHRTGAFGSLDGHVKSRLDVLAENPSSDPRGDDQQTSVDAIVDVAYTFCASFEGLKILLGDDGLSSETSAQLTGLYRLSYGSFDDGGGRPIARDVLVMLWLRLIEAATRTFTLRAYADLRLNYQDTLSRLSAENRTADGTVFVAETTELLAKLQRPAVPSPSDRAPAADDTTVTGAPAEFPSDDDGGHGREPGVWLRGVRATVIRADRISDTGTIDTIISFGRRRFDVEPLGPEVGADLEHRQTDMDAAGIRLAIRYGSSLGLVSECPATAVELGRLLRGDAGTLETRPFDCTTCALFVACRGSGTKCAEARAVLLGREETSRFFWPPAYDADAHRKAAFGHLAEGLLRQELPEVYNAFQMSGVSWWLLCSGWASDCFWGRLLWPEVCRWLCLAALFPVDYQAFFFTCLAAARKRQWLEAFNRGRFLVTVYQDDFYDFRLADYADYLDGLAKKHQRSISKRLASEFDTN